MTSTRQTTDSAEALARETFRGDWDANGTTSVHLPREIAGELLTTLGWYFDENRGAWVSPHGYGPYWETSEALQIALTAETLANR